MSASEPLSLVVGFSPGSASDLLAAALRPALAARLGREVRIDRRTGDNGAIDRKSTRLNSSH